MNLTPPTNTPKHLARAALLAALSGAAASAFANPAGVEVIAVTGTSTANGVMNSFSLQPSIGDGGHVSFHVYLTGTTLGDRDAYAHFRASPASPPSIIELSRKSNPLPDGNGFMEAPYFGSVNASGLTAGQSYFMGTSAGDDDNSGIVISSGGPVGFVVREGSPLPDNDGTYTEFEAAHLNDAGQVTFWASTDNTQSGYESGIFRASGGPVSTIVRTGDPAPGGIGTFDHISSRIDAKGNGVIAFCATLNNAGDNLHDNRVYRHSAGVTTTIAREGDPSPDANGQLWHDNGNFIPLARASKSGFVAFRSDLLGTAGGASDNAAIFRGTGGPLTLIARLGQPAPGGNGTISELYIPDVADTGTVIFEADFAGTTGGETDDRALLSGTGGILTTIMRENQPTPSGDGQLVVGYFTNWNCNAAGEMAIRTDLRNTQAGGQYENAIYFYRPGSPLIEIARNGTPLLGSTITLLNSTDQSFAPSLSPINESGQIAFYFALADGRDGVADRKSVV